MPSESPGGRALRNWRGETGLSQADLSARSGVSVRTIRGIESGAIRAPHASTLLALATGLKLPAGLLERFLVSWPSRPAPTASLSSVMAISDGAFDAFDRALAAGDLRNRRGETRLLSLSRRASIGADRKVCWIEEQQVVEMLADDVSGYVIQLGSTSDVRLIRVDQLVGCELAARWEDVDTGVLALDLSFGHPLKRGEVKAFSIRWGLGDSPPNAPELLSAWNNRVDAVRHHFGHIRPLQHLMIQVAFAGEVPAAVRRVEESSAVVRAEEITPDEFGTVSLFGRDLAPGSQRLEWDWS